MLMRNGQKPEQSAVRVTEIPNHIEWLERMAQFFDLAGDENSGIPKYQTGEGEGGGAQGTARGLSMLMGAANVVTKDQVGQWDDVVRSFLTSLYHWNMKFHRDPTIKGDFDVKIRATASLIAKEVKAQAISQFAAQTNNPVDQQFVKRDVMLRALAESLELSDIVKSEDEVKQDQQDPRTQQMAKLQSDLAQAQLALAQGQAAKANNEAQLILTRVKEVVANIDQIIAKTIETKVETIFAALQAGGVATQNPVTAPAGDEILRSAGYRDVTPSPSIAQLDGPPVQQQANDTALLPKGSSFAQDPRAPAVPGAAPAADSGDAAPAPGDAAAGVAPSTTLHPQHIVEPGPASDPMAHQLPDANTGEMRGIETTRIEK
jgi:hypothetical protein